MTSKRDQAPVPPHTPCLSIHSLQANDTHVHCCSHRYICWAKLECKCQWRKKGKFISRMKPITPHNTNNIQISQVAAAAYLLHSHKHISTTNTQQYLMNNSALSVRYQNITFYSPPRQRAIIHCKVLAGKPSQSVTSHMGQLSLAIHMWLGAVDTSDSWD